MTKRRKRARPKAKGRSAKDFTDLVPKAPMDDVLLLDEQLGSPRTHDELHKQLQKLTPLLHEAGLGGFVIVGMRQMPREEFDDTGFKEEPFWYRSGETCPTLLAGSLTSWASEDIGEKLKDLVHQRRREEQEDATSDPGIPEGGYTPPKLEMLPEPTKKEHK